MMRGPNMQHLKGSDMHSPNDTRLPERFRAQFVVNNETGCWEWQGHLDVGYGRYWLDGKTQLAHRLAYTLLISDIPDDLVIDHLCRVRHCVYPDHMEVVTAYGNTIVRGRGPIAMNLHKTHCKRGHPFSGENLKIRVSKNGRIGRACKACSRDASARYAKDVKANA